MGRSTKAPLIASDLDGLNLMAISSVFLGFCALGLLVISFGVFGFIPAVPGVICGHLGARQEREDPTEFGRICVIVGLSLNWIALALSLLSVLVVVGFFLLMFVIYIYGVALATSY